LYGAYIPRNDFESILTLKMETRHPVGESLGSEFPAICNHFVVMAYGGLKSQDFAIL